MVLAPSSMDICTEVQVGPNEHTCDAEFFIQRLCKVTEGANAVSERSREEFGRECTRIMYET